MSHSQRTISQDSSSDSIRKRVCKACDRCRLKKSKCDGANPCSRCKADNAICVFGERKKSHDKVYPKGYVEMLEQQQSQLVLGLQEMYKRLQSAQAWIGPPLPETNGHPLTHDILSALNLLETKHDGSGETESFEEDCQKLQSKLIAEGAGFAQRRGSVSSDSDHSQQGHGQPSLQGTPTLSKPPLFKESFNFASSSPSPLSQSPRPQQRRSYPAAQPSLLHTSPLSNDAQPYHQPQWAAACTDMSSPDHIMRSKFDMHAPQFTAYPRLDTMDGFLEAGAASTPWEGSPISYDTSFDNMTSYPQQLGNGFGVNMQGISTGMNDFNTFDSMDLDFSKFIQPMEVVS